MTRHANANRAARAARIGKRKAPIACAAILSVSPTISAVAHHSFSAEFDATKEVRATGAVTDLEWQNPHAWIHLRVTEVCERAAAPRGRGRGNGDVVEAEWECRTPGADEQDWAFEMGSPNGLMRQGWTRNSLQADDVVTISGTRARDGSTNSNARTVTTEDGTRLFAGSSENSTP